MKKKIFNSVLKLIKLIARNGVGEKIPAKGVFIIIGKKTKLLSKKYGKLPKYNKYKDNQINVIDIVNDTEKLRFVLPDFITDGAIVIDSDTGNIISNNYSVINLTKGTMKSGKKHQAASSISKLTKSVVFKVSEDDCLVDGVGKGYINFFNKSNKYKKINIIDTKKFCKTRCRYYNKTKKK